MKHFYLCGHTGSVNRGCDAIVRSTVGILKECGAEDISLMTFAQAQDKQLRLNELAELIPYPKKPFWRRAAGKVVQKVFHNGTWGNRCLYRSVVEQADRTDWFLNIGGDTYCYGKPYLSYTLNEMAEEKGISNVFWGCSVDGRLRKDAQMQRDVNRYTHIVARESLSYQLISDCLADKSKVHLACDPAFTLEMEETALPEGFVRGNTLGINVSPLVFADPDYEEDMMYRNVYCLIDYVLEHTDMSVCLVPHVYNLSQNTQDIKVLRKIAERYQDSRRVCIVEEELNSCQLKYIISQCRFFIGARTHSMIAAYSAMVPALALSYSIKSLGIAKDIFGTYEGYAIPWKSFKEPGQLRDVFISTLLEKEEWIREHYQKVMPEYRMSIVKTAKEIFAK